MTDLTIVFAFIAGFISFLSPCVLPLIPGFLSYLAGSSLGEAKVNQKAIFLNSVFFVLGFSVVFALLGVLLNSLLESVAYDVQLWLSRIGGIIIIFFGLYLIGLIDIPFLYQEHKFHPKLTFHSRYITSLLFGAAFAFGWTPCVGPVLGSILGLAATKPGSAFTLLLSYAIGLGIPFLIVGLFTSQATSFITKYQRGLRYITIIFGFFLIALGILAFTQKLNLIANLEILNAILLR